MTGIWAVAGLARNVVIAAQTSAGHGEVEEKKQQGGFALDGGGQLADLDFWPAPDNPNPAAG